MVHQLTIAIDIEQQAEFDTRFLISHFIQMAVVYQAIHTYRSLSHNTQLIHVKHLKNLYAQSHNHKATIW